MTTQTTEATSKFRNRGEHYVRQIPVGSIRPDPEQPRKVFDEEALRELAASIQENGLLQPIAVRPDPEHEDGYLIIAGERRYRAHVLNGAAKIKAMILDADETRATKLQLIENLNRADLNPVEEAEAYKKLLANDWTLGDIAKVTGTPAGHIAWRVQMLECREDVLDMVAKGQVKPLTAHAISRLTPENQGIIIRAMATNNLTYHQIQKMCNRLSGDEQQADFLDQTPEKTAAAKQVGCAFDEAFDKIGRLLDKINRIEEAHPGSVFSALSENTATQGKITECIKGLNQVNALLKDGELRRLIDES